MRTLVFCLSILMAVFLVAGNAAAVSISAEAIGSLQPGTATHPNTVTNGDFTITGNSIATLVGNGVDESTAWSFDFTSDSGFGAFSSSNPLISAVLTLTLLPKNGLITTDAVRIQGLNNITTPIQVLPVNVVSTISFDLLSYYSSAAVLGAMAAGVIDMYYSDDAILSYAKLELTNSAAVPEPGTLFLLGGALLGLVGVSRRLRQ